MTIQISFAWGQMGIGQKEKYFYEHLPKAGGINIPNIFWDFNELHAPNDKVRNIKTRELLSL
jgi:hypothetical protein